MVRSILWFYVSLKHDFFCVTFSPLNIFTLENRYTVAAAFGSISFILADIVLEAKYAIDFSGAIWLRSKSLNLEAPKLKINRDLDISKSKLVPNY